MSMFLKLTPEVLLSIIVNENSVRHLTIKTCMTEDALKQLSINSIKLVSLVLGVIKKKNRKYKP